MPRRSLTVLYKDRLGFLACLLVPMLVIGAILRIVLYASFSSAPASALPLLLALVAGLVFDWLAMALALSPVALTLAGLRMRWLSRWWVRLGLFTAFFAGVLFQAAIEFFFFDEFNARYNHIALDYLLSPREVFVNIWESYNVPLFVGFALGVGLLLALPAMRYTRGLSFGPLPWSARWRGMGAVAIVLAACVVAEQQLPEQVSHDRLTSEIAQNGWNQLVRAYATAHLPYDLYYRTLPEEVARARAGRFLGFDRVPSLLPARNGEDRFPFEKTVGRKPAPGQEPLNAVVILEESLGSEFIGVLGHRERKTSPDFDRWSVEGTLFTNLVANGNRTVRGLEGVLCSFVPLPGDSIVKRSRSENVASLARVFAGEGYRTAFFYGGYGIFDNMKPFMTSNGYQEFIQQPDFPGEAFRTIWGVADEFVFDELLARQKRAAAEGQRFFATVMTVSNHKPYAVPVRLTGRPAGERRRDGAVRYSDWALGRYLDQAREAGVLDNTVVLIVGDHGARVYGSEEIPAASYRIPALVLAPDPSWRGRRIERLCSQIDLAPVVLAASGIEVESPFLGEDVTRLPADGGRAFVQHNRDIGLLSDRLLVVLGLQKTATFYTREGRGSDAFTRVPEDRVTASMRELELDATAVFQTAYGLYQDRRYRLPPHGLSARLLQPDHPGRPGADPVRSSSPEVFAILFTCPV
jgi:phosphoglycerol transferase MdoB-like AlkP superfamily enzyme